MTIHRIDPERATLHGVFSRDLKPVLTIESGETVRFRTLESGWGLEPPVAPGVTQQKFAPRIDDLDGGHAMCGPVAIQGAQPGMTLAVQIQTVIPGNWGYTIAGGWDSALNARLGVAELPEQLMLWHLDVPSMTGVNQQGHRLALRPFPGIIGMPPPEPGKHPSWPPRVWGGNIDCKDLVAGSTLYLPIPVPDALVSVGDGHAVQGDGEVNGVAIECPLDCLEATFVVHDDLPITTPRANTPAGWITFGFDPDLETAMFTALNAMLDLMGAQYQLARAQALALASLVVVLRITQIVNGVRGVHAVLPHGAIGAGPG